MRKNKKIYISFPKKKIRTVVSKLSYILIKIKRIAFFTHTHKHTHTHTHTHTPHTHTPTHTHARTHTQIFPIAISIGKL